MNADHLLHYRPGAEGFGSWRLECIDGVCPQESWGEPVRAWPDDRTCRCTMEGNDCESCSDGDHGGCGYFGRYIEEVGYECRSEYFTGPGNCWTVQWMDELGDECIVGDDWPEDVLPLPVAARWIDGCMELAFAPPPDDASPMR